MEELVKNLGARFLVGDPHPTASASGFAQGVLLNRDVARALGGRHRLLHVFSHEEHDKSAGRTYPKAFEAVFYDYAANMAVRVKGTGSGPYRITRTREQPLPNKDEFNEAVTLVAASPSWGPLLQSGRLTAYEPMPPIREVGDGGAERTLYVGLHSPERKFNRIVAVNMIRREVTLEGVKPRGTSVRDHECGVPYSNCSDASFQGRPGFADIEWPAKNPVWKFRAIRPSASSGLNASGIELRNVRFRDRTVLQQAHMPILNVNYEGDTCGPYRDWLWREWCFNVPGIDIPGTEGFRMCPPGELPQTVLDGNEVDGGNFVGVAVYETADGALGLTSQCSAGWYRYVMDWFFYPDGKLLPRMRFGGVQNACVCNIHNHHAFWRFDFDVLGSKNILEEKVGEVWQPIKRETTRFRRDDNGPIWRVRNYQAKTGYEIISGEMDGKGDLFSGPDYYAFAWAGKGKQVDDGRTLVSDARADIKRFANRANIYKQDLVVWYSAHFRHTVSESGRDDDHSHSYGPVLQPFGWPE